MTTPLEKSAIAAFDAARAAANTAYVAWAANPSATTIDALDTTLDALAAALAARDAAYYAALEE